MTLLEVYKKLNTNRKCLDFIEKIRWQNGVICPRCHNQNLNRIQSRDKFECSNCKYQFNSIAGTVLSKTYIPLQKWILAIYLYCQQSGRLKPSELAKVLDLPYKTAWHLNQKIKKNSTNHEFNKLGGLF